jgi:putative intracellular protease/amidase
MKVKVVVDGRLITGQNPASGKAVGEAVLAALLGTSTSVEPKTDSAGDV